MARAAPASVSPAARTSSLLSPLPFAGVIVRGDLMWPPGDELCRPA